MVFTTDKEKHLYIKTVSTFAGKTYLGSQILNTVAAVANRRAQLEGSCTPCTAVEGSWCTPALQPLYPVDCYLVDMRSITGTALFTTLTNMIS